MTWYPRHVSENPGCRVNCKEHGVVTCGFPWARHNSRFARKFEEQTAWMAVNCSRVAVAAFMRISWNTVGLSLNVLKKTSISILMPDLITLFVLVLMKLVIVRGINTSRIR